MRKTQQANQRRHSDKPAVAPHLGVAIHLRGAGEEHAGLDVPGQTQHVEGAQGANLDGLPQAGFNQLRDGKESAHEPRTLPPMCTKPKP